LAAGRVTPRERLPALRELAEGLGVNTNTIRAVYRRLEQRLRRGPPPARRPLGPEADRWLEPLLDGQRP
jgi:DNA-binding transcriptional MocR family regulator